MLTRTILAAMAIAVMTSTAALAEEGGRAGAGGGEKRAERFAEMKQKALARLDEKRACVSAAQDVEALKKCFPHRGGGGGEGKRLGGRRRGGAEGGGADDAQ
ncbi:MAG TPA: hypothetical protein VEF76_02600 [Patescibacteria group bacterium]|nr:hypothetical protein [Patescibacteria group bacterium]